MSSASRIVPRVMCAVALAALWSASTANAGVIGELSIDDGYLDYFVLTDTRVIDVGTLGGGLDNDPSATKTIVTAQATTPSPPMPSDGRLTGIVHGKFRVNFLTDVSGDGFINGTDLNALFDVSWQLVGFDKNIGNASAFFESSVAVGPEGTARTFGPPDSVNFPPTAGGTASAWNIAGCSTNGGFDVGSGLENCNQFAIDTDITLFYTGFIDYTFPVSIPGTNDFTPGPMISTTNWVLAALVANTADAVGGAVAFGSTPAYDPEVAVINSETDLFGPNTLLNFPGEQANVAKANLLTTVQISVVPEPSTVGLLVLGGLFLARRRR